MIKIGQKFRPFSLSPGTFFQIPGSHLFCRIFPSLIQILDKNNNVLNQLDVEVSCNNFFCVMQDLHKIGVKVFIGNVRYWISNKGIIRRGKALSQKNLFSSEFLSLGVNKKLDWEMIYRRKNLLEILPLWFRLGILTPKVNLTEDEKKSENFLLFSSITKDFFSYSKDQQYQLLHKLFFSCFPFNLVPQQQNIYLPKIHQKDFFEQKSLPLFLVREGASFIKSLFIKIENNIFYIFPCLLQQFHSGRFINISCGSLGSIDLKWSKKMIKKIIFRSYQEGIINFLFPKKIVKFRLTNLESKEKKILLTSSFIEIKSKTTYVLDCFQK